MKTYDQQIGEKAKSYNLFLSYCALGDRSLLKLAQTTGKSIAHIKRLSSRFNWVARAADYDADLHHSLLAQQKQQHLADLQSFMARKIETSRQIESVARGLLEILESKVADLCSDDIKPELLGQLLRHAAFALRSAGEIEASGLAVKELLEQLDPMNISDNG